MKNVKRKTTVERKIIKRFKSKNLRIFLIFVFASSILWFFNKLNQEFVSQLEIPVTYINFPPNRSNVSQLPQNFVASVKANGYDLLKFEFKKQFSQVAIDLSQVDYVYSKNNDSSSAYVMTYKFKDEIEMQLKGKITIEQIKPDTLYFLFSKLVSKYVPIVPKIEITPEDQFFVKTKASVAPDSIKITGPKIILDTIENIKTQFTRFKKLNKNLKSSVNLLIPSGVISNISKVNVFAEIEQFTEINFKLNIQTFNVPDSMVMKLYPNSVLVSCKVGVSNYKKVDADMFEVVVDYNSIFERKDNKLPVKIISYPSNIYSFSCNPEFVDYVMEKKKK